MDLFMDAIMDTLKLFPFLYVVYLFLEYLEHHVSLKTFDRIKKTSRFGPLWGSVLGIFPQCGFASMAVSLFITKVISVGTLVAIFLATSDEMLPILISRQAPLSFIAQVLLIKVSVGMIVGVLVTWSFPKTNLAFENEALCVQDNCKCEENIFIAAFRHSLKIALYIFVITLGLNYTLEFIDLEALLLNSGHAVWVAALVGLIPNCASSIVLTELYLEQAIGFGPLIAGLLTNSGVGLLVLVKLNKNRKENLKIVASLLLTGLVVGYFFYLI